MKSISQNTVALLILTCVGGVLLLKIAVPLLFFAIPVRFESAWGYEPKSGRYKQIQIHAAGSGARDSDVIEDSIVTLTLLTLTGESKTLQLAYKGDAIYFANHYCSPEKLQAWMRSQGVKAHVNKSLAHSVIQPMHRPKSGLASHSWSSQKLRASSSNCVHSLLRYGRLVS